MPTQTTLMPNRQQSLQASSDATPPDQNACLAPLPRGIKAQSNTPELLRHDLQILAKFICVYCHAKHTQCHRITLKGFDLKELTGTDLELCPDCAKLLAHAFVKRSHCPRDPKPQCKHCPTHCYQKVYRERIREVMRFSGMRLLLTGRIDFLYHLFF